jgi:hypothetical protein
LESSGGNPAVNSDAVMRVAAEIDAARNSAGSAPLLPSSGSAGRLELPPPPGLVLDPVPVVVLADDEDAPAVEQVAAVDGEAVDPPLEDGEQGVALNVVGPLAAGGAAAANPAMSVLLSPPLGNPRSGLSLLRRSLWKAPRRVA